MSEDVVGGGVHVGGLISLHVSRVTRAVRARGELLPIEQSLRANIEGTISSRVVAKGQRTNVVRNRCVIESVAGGVGDNPTREHAREVRNFSLTVSRHSIAIGIKHRCSILIQYIGAN